MDLSNRWLRVVGFPIVGFLLLWWADTQFETIRRINSSTFVWPSTRSLGWLLTLIAVGAAFGLAARAARTGSSGAHVGATFVVMILPVFVVFYFWTFLSLGWFRVLPQNFFWVTNQSTIVMSCAAIGFLLINLIPSRGSKRS
jgi:hypothetical protein